MARTSLTRALLTAGFLLAASTGAAYAQDHGRLGGRAIWQAIATASANHSSVTQEGSANGAAIVQNGQGNNATLRQYGNGNTGAITQNGDNNIACLVQVGRGLDGSIVQVGDNQNVGVLQTRRGTREFPAALCSLRDNRNGAMVGLARQAAARIMR